MTTYPLSLSDEELAAEDEATQLEVMRHWFYQHYEDPAESCPHDSGEGGFQFIYGGPYDAWDELNDEFGGVVPDNVIEKLAKKLADQCPEWSGIPKAEHFDDVDEYYLNALVSTADPYGDLQASLSQTNSVASASLFGISVSRASCAEQATPSKSPSFSRSANSNFVVGVGSR